MLTVIGTRGFANAAELQRPFLGIYTQIVKNAGAGKNARDVSSR
ncbi:MAG: hypothetical protein QS721_05600 [Candidatus Endonucleobacter sp. (ex Gigantidas childressi)]|nr:hypothetical protein [Candidatus Endonucleobacter sp. (ex Gigantidas childressi)]